MTQNDLTRIAADILIAYIGSPEFEKGFNADDSNKTRAEAIAEAFNIIHAAVVSPLADN
jgi:hypothetical protein